MEGGRHKKRQKIDSDMIHECYNNSMLRPANADKLVHAALLLILILREEFFLLVCCALTLSMSSKPLYVVCKVSVTV